MSGAGPASLSGLKPSGSLNPFDSGASVNSALSTPPAAPSMTGSASLNPFDAQPAQGPSAVGGGSLNPFDAQPAQNYSAVESGFESSPASSIDPQSAFEQSAFAAEPMMSQDSNDQVSEAEAEQLRSLAPLNFAPTEIPLSTTQLPPELTAGLINRSLAVSMTLGAAGAALLIGLLMGIVFDQRRAHNYRVDAWNNIDAQLAGPLDEVALINDTIQESLKQPVIKWDLIEKLPKKLSAVPPTLTATRVPLEQKAVLELSKLIHEVNLLFADISEHRILTLSSRGELEMKGKRKSLRGL